MKLVTVRKQHECTGCGDPIPKGTAAEFYTGKMPKFERIGTFAEKQTGIEYYKFYFHTYRCDLEPERRALCEAGNHEWEVEYEFDHYVECHRVYAPTNNDVCKHCGETRPMQNDDY
jgi:hypothetical protein